MAEGRSVTDPITAPAYPPSPFQRWIERSLYDPRDAVFARLTLKVLAIMAPLILLQFLWFSWWLAAVVFVVQLPLLAPPVILMLHNTMHRPFIKHSPALNRAHRYAMSLLFGIPTGYLEHHLGMHHAENNLPPDLSSTMRYQRDHFGHWLIYLARFLFLSHVDLATYFVSKGRGAMARRALLSDAVHVGLIAALSFVDWRASLTTLAVPYLVVRFMMMMGNWGQHAFIDPMRPGDSLVNSITCINVSYNRRCFNDGYHIGHHLKQNRHWTELPQDFVANRERYRAEGCVVFHGLDFFMVSVLLFLHRYDVLAKRFVRMGDDTRTDAAIIEFLKSRTLRFVPSRGLAVQLAALSTALGLLSSTAWAGAPSSSLLAGAVPTRQEGLVRAAAMTDGHRPPEGAFWDSEVTAVLAPSGVVEWDLGEPRAVAAALLQADNNDTYVLSASLDGATWAPLWSAPPRDEPGLQTRTERALNLMVRYVRLTAEGGDGLYSIGEIQLFSNAGELPSVAPTVRRTTPVVTGRDPTALILLAVFGGILVFIHRQGTATPRARGTAEP